MTDITIRQVHGEKLAEISRLLFGYAFRPSPPLPTKEESLKQQEYLDDALHLVLFADGQPMVIAASSPMSQNVRGKLFQAGGVWGVTTHPESRRNGYARQLLTRLLAELHEQGDVFSTLYPFRESFYQRLGYTTFPQLHTFQFSPVALQPLLKQELKGKVSLIPFSEGSGEYHRYLEKVQQTLHGMGLFKQSYTAGWHEPERYWLAIARIDGEIHGIMHYTLLGNRENMRVPRFYYSDSRGKYLLLEWFARHIDHVSQVELRVSADEHPQAWFADLAPTIRVEDTPMGRVLDVLKLNGLPTGAGYFSARISDPTCPWNEGSYHFESNAGRLEVSKATTAECQLSIQALTALVYGTHDPETFAIREWGNPSAELQDTMRKMFPARQPYLHEIF
jgi:predicted acetyltransferase